MPHMPSRTLTRRRFVLAGGAALSSSVVRAGVARSQGRRGEIIAGLSERMLTLDPANHYSISATSVLRHVYDPLLDVTNDDKFVPALAESWRALNNTTWRFTLRQGVSFHDGSPS
jgi:peptide/nickel transport system substrate-binding protein